MLLQGMDVVIIVIIVVTVFCGVSRFVWKVSVWRVRRQWIGYQTHDGPVVRGLWRLEIVRSVVDGLLRRYGLIPGRTGVGDIKCPNKLVRLDGSGEGDRLLFLLDVSVGDGAIRHKAGICACSSVWSLRFPDVRRVGDGGMTISAEGVAVVGVDATDADGEEKIVLLALIEANEVEEDVRCGKGGRVRFNRGGVVGWNSD